MSAVPPKYEPVPIEMASRTSQDKRRYSEGTLIGSPQTVSSKRFSHASITIKQTAGSTASSPTQIAFLAVSVTQSIVVLGLVVTIYVRRDASIINEVVAFVNSSLT